MVPIDHASLWIMQFGIDTLRSHREIRELDRTDIYTPAPRIEGGLSRDAFLLPQIVEPENITTWPATRGL